MGTLREIISLTEEEKEKDRTLSYDKALKRAYKKNPHLTASYMAKAGSEEPDLAWLTARMKIIADLAQDLLARDSTLIKIDAIMKILEDDPSLARDLITGRESSVL